MSRRRENGQPATAWDAMGVFRSPSFGAMLGLGTTRLALFVVWIMTAQAIYTAAFGYETAANMPDFATRILTTPQGWWLIVAGCGDDQPPALRRGQDRSEEHTSELQSQSNLVCRLLLEKKIPMRPMVAAGTNLRPRARAPLLSRSPLPPPRHPSPPPAHTPHASSVAQIRPPHTAT